ncbi:MAG TPA: esterase-like activity of phytase family protein [Thermoanaerobaculia bacterium]|nr:esterase-like activity of phytase family protein [Thermoanaerobaculia bacterium]
MPRWARGWRAPGLLLALGATLACAGGGPPRGAPPAKGPAAIGAPPAVEVVGRAWLPSGLSLDGVLVGGLSGIAYDAAADLYLAVSDDPGERGPPRFYTLRIPIVDGRLEAPGVEVTGWQALLGSGGGRLPGVGADLEGIALAGDGTLYVASEGDARVLVAPFLARHRRDGLRVELLQLPAAFLPDGAGRGVRFNMALESVTLSPDERWLYTATEGPLEQDGAEAAVGRAAWCRILEIDLTTGARREIAYRVDPVHAWPPVPGSLRVSGLVELLALERGELLALERSFAMGAGFAIKLYRVSLGGADDVSAVASLATAPQPRPAAKRLLLDLGAAGVPLDNLEGMTFGPRLPDGRRSLVLVSDDNFDPEQTAQVVVLAVPDEALRPSPPG